MKLRFVDWVVILGIAFITMNSGPSWVSLLVATGVIFLYLIVRVLWPKQTILNPGRATVEEEDDTFIIAANRDHDTVEKEVLELDADISYRKAPNHFRIHRQFDIYVSDWEYEYRVSPTGVSVRLLQLRSEDPGEPEEWMVRDGVVQEADMRAAWAKKKFKWDDVEEKIANLK